MMTMITMRLRDCARNTLCLTRIYHIDFILMNMGITVREFNACHPLAKEYDNPNSIYCYSETDFGDLLNDIYAQKMSVYDVSKAGFVSFDSVIDLTI